jgi:hypothetical protein
MSPHKPINALAVLVNLSCFRGLCERNKAEDPRGRDVINPLDRREKEDGEED